MEISQIVGFTGSALVLLAYVPQTRHLIKERCSAGISRYAYVLWFIAAILLLSHAVMINALIFIVLQSINTIFTGVILAFAEKYKYGLCATHAVSKNT